MSTFKELLEEFKSILSGKIPILDVVLPPLLFTLFYGWLSVTVALVASLITAGLLVGLRIWQRQSFGYTLGGAGITLTAGAVAWVSQSARGFFLPGVLSSGITFLAAAISLVIQRPLAALSSHLTRGWPLTWYWHPRVRPAYSEVTAGWTLFFGLQFGIQLTLYLQGTVESLGIVQLLTGWPALILVLAASYLYGLWRLKQLQGPSVSEFEEEKDPPWKGQQRGF